MSAVGQSPGPASHLPDVQYGSDGTLVVHDPDGMSNSVNTAATGSHRDGDAQIWMMAEAALRREELLSQRLQLGDNQPKPQPAAQSDPGGTGPSTDGSSSRYKRHVTDSMSKTVGTSAQNTASVSTASSSLLRRLRLRRSKSRHSVRKADSDVSEKRRRGGRKQRNKRKDNESSPQSGFSIDKPVRRNSVGAVQPPVSEHSGASPDVADDAESVEQPVTNNAYWQEMINEARRRHRSDSPKQSPSRRKQRTSVPSRNSTSTGSRRSMRSFQSSTAGSSRFGGGPPRISAEDAASLSRRHPDQLSSQFSVTSSNNELIVMYDEERSSSRRENSRCCACRCCVERSLDGPCAAGTWLVVTGCLLVAVGITRLLVCYWHEIGSSVWAGIPVIIHTILFINYLTHFSLYL